MRAPPVAVKQTNGTFCSIAVSTPRTKRSPTTEPIEPPMKSNSKQAATSGTLMHRAAASRPARRSRRWPSSASFRRSGYFLLSLNLSGSTGTHFLADLVAAFGVEEGVEARARADAVVVVALRADVEVLLEVGLVEHRLARRALDPQALGHRAALGRVGRAGSSAAAVFRASSCVMLLRSSIERGADLGDERRAPRGAHCRAVCASSNLHQRACRSPPRRPPRATACGAGARRGCRSRRRPAPARARGCAAPCCATRGGVEVAGAGHALQRHVVDVAAARCGRPARMRCVGGRRREQEDRVDAGRLRSCAANASHSSGG